ncbi:hypothetical protein RND81_13G100800 [Saponaria officinalis]|uniref:RING-type E3 ubiquitin transferase n=1 Tax=Saponaria officinalis TaxID=3572 RepID=A0AAW1GYV4_SAPOF
MATTPPLLPCDGDGVCMRCKSKPSDAEKLTCKTCVTPWHVDCLSTPPSSMSAAAQWECPDCAPFPADVDSSSVVNSAVDGGGLVAAIRAIEADAALSDIEKARKRQELLSGKMVENASKDGVNVKDDNEILNILGDNIKCSFCMQLPDRPVTTPCGHNFCLKCFEKWVGQGKKTCAKCRKSIPASMTSQPRINSSLVFAIRAARTQKPAAVEGPRVFKFIDNDNLPDEAFTTERAVKAGKANAKSGKIFVTIPHDHLGPITAEYDPVRKTGLLVGDSWTDRLACRQWGAHFPHVSGIAGQSKHGAQSVVLSGGYEDDEDHGEWFIYTGSGGRDLSGNKRTNKEQSSDQKFTGGNESLRLSCRKGYPVRVVRSFKEKRSNYAPESGVRYDGVYRIEKCWIKLREQDKDGKRHKVCRYLFVRCDNSPAPWTSDEHGDRPRPLPNVPELKHALQLTERNENAYWDFDEVEGCWKWIKPAPPSKMTKGGGGGGGGSRLKKSSKAKILKEFSCLLCRKVLTLPITTPCAHNFCKTCLDGAFEGQKFVRERQTGGRQLRTQKTVMKCPSCPSDLSGFLQNAQVNRELMGVIESLMRKFEEEEKTEEACKDESSDIMEEDEDDEDDEDAAPEDEQNTVSENVETETVPLENTDDGDKAEPAAPAAKKGRKRKNEAEQNTGSENVETETVPLENTDDGDKAEPAAPAAKKGRKRKNEVEQNTGSEDVETVTTPLENTDDGDKAESAAPAAKKGRKRKNEAEQNTGSENVETETVPLENTDDGDKAEPAAPAAKKGRKRKNEADQNPASENVETETVPLENTDDGDTVEPAAPAAKRGRKRKNEAPAPPPAPAAAPVKKRGRGRPKKVADDGNDSPSSPLHVPLDNELE